MKNRKLILLPIMGIVIAVLVWGMYSILRQTGLVQINQQRGSITIQDAYLTLDPELSKPNPGQIPTFPSDAGRIYLAVFLESEIPVHLGVRWYFEDKVIVHQSATIDRPFAWHIQVETAEGFFPGNYRAEIFLIEEPVQVVNL